MLLNGKVVLITGASRGIGAACAQAFARRGALLSLTSRTNCAFSGALFVPGDITSPAARAQIVDRTIDRYGRIDVLINNAGAGRYGPSSESTEETARAVFDLNFFAPLAMARLILPYMRAQQSGSIVNVASIAGQVPLPWMTIYSASKSGLISLTGGLRRELHGTGIHAMSVCPGYVKTEFHAHATGQPPRKLAEMMKYATTPEHCAEAIVRGVERGARTVVTPWWGRPFIALNAILPSVVDSRLSRIGL